MGKQSYAKFAVPHAMAFGVKLRATNSGMVHHFDDVLLVLHKTKE